MMQSPLICSVWISLLAFTAVSCQTPAILLSGAKTEQFIHSIANASFEKAVMKSTMIFKDQELSGQMIIKNTGEGQYKIAFFSELGMTYFDGSFIDLPGQTGFNANNIAPFIDHPMVIKNLEKIFRLLFSPMNVKTVKQSEMNLNEKEIMLITLPNGFRMKMTL